MAPHLYCLLNLIASIEFTENERTPHDLCEIVENHVIQQRLPPFPFVVAHNRQKLGLRLRGGRGVLFRLHVRRLPRVAPLGWRRKRKARAV